MFIVSHYFIYSFGIHVLWCNMQRGDAYRTEHPFKSPAILLSSRSNTTAVNFLCLFCPTREFFPFLGRHHCRWRVANFDLCSALMAIEQWGFFSVPDVLWHGATVYNGHIPGPVTIIYNAERLAVQLSLPVFTT